MKKMLMVFALAALVSTGASAAEKRKAYSDDASAGGGIAGGGSDGCGLGWQVTDKKTFFGTTTRGTTNAVIPPTFGMTSGTIGCEQHGFAMVDQKAMNYASTNLSPLSVEMAEGRGEFLQGFARTLGCSDAVLPQFGAMTQKNYDSLSKSATGVELFQKIKQQISSDAALKAGCSA